MWLFFYFFVIINFYLQVCVEFSLVMGGGIMSDEYFFTFTLGEGSFAIPVAFVREVLNYESIRF